VDSQSELTSTTADLEDRRRRRGKLRVDERRQIHDDRSKAGAHGITVLVRNGETVDILLTSRTSAFGWRTATSPGTTRAE
jgi:hypothetical protein